MSKKIRVLIVAVFAVAALSVVASSASALTATISLGGAISTTSLGKLTSAAAGTNIQSNVTLSGSITRGTYNTGGVFGTITRCAASGTMPTGFTVDCTLLTNGTLPVGAVTAALVLFTLSNAKFLIHIPAVGDCLYSGTVGASIPTGTSQLIRVLSTTVSLFRTLSGSCPPSGTLTGTFGALTPAQTVTVP